MPKRNKKRFIVTVYFGSTAHQQSLGGYAKSLVNL